MAALHSPSVFQAWLRLLALSAGTAALTLLPLPSVATGGRILLLAVLKSRLILSRYLALAQASGLLRGITVVLTGFAMLVFALSLA